MSATVIAFPHQPRRVCQAYLDRTHNATVIILPVRRREQTIAGLVERMRRRRRVGAGLKPAPTGGTT